jgi:hypothetical protein
VPGEPAWAQGASLWYDFVAGSGNLGAVTDTHAGTIYAPNSAGLYLPFGANVPVLTDLGLQTTLTRTNSCLRSRDMTNAAWTKSNMTTAETATGIDGVVNSATTLTASAGNATVLQAITLASSADTYSVFLKRISGTGNIDITIDNGSTWTTKVLTTAWQRFSVTQTLANPTVGIRIVTSGDSVAADFSQLEVGACASSPIPTTAAGVTLTGNQQVISSGISGLDGGFSGFVKINTLGIGISPNPGIVIISDGTYNNDVIIDQNAGNFRNVTLSGGGLQAVVTGDAESVGSHTIVFAAGLDYVNLQLVGGSAASADVSATRPTGLNKIGIGGSGFDTANNNYQFLQKIALFPANPQSAATLAATYTKAALA